MKITKHVVAVVAALAMSAAVLVASSSATLGATVNQTRAVSLGDSYTAGNGAEGTTVAGLVNDYLPGGCSQHPNAYPFLVVESFPNATLDHLACSDATTNDVLVDQLPAIVDPGDVDFYFITIGGNDFGFSSVVATCLVLGLSNLCSNDLDDAEALLPSVLADTEAILDDLALSSPNAQIIFTGYPLLASPFCPTGIPNQERLTDLQILLDDSQAAIADARDHVSFVSVIDAFADEGPCKQSTTPPITRGAGLVHHLYLIDPFAESFHPNIEGHEAIAEEILQLGLTATPTCNGLQVTVDINAGEKPTSGDDVILGTPLDDLILAGDGDDTICGGDGDDTINAGPGDDTVFAGDGDDTVFGLDGRDTIHGEAGVDELLGQGEGDTIFGGLDADTINGGEGNDALGGGAGADTIFGVDGNDTLSGGPGNDKLFGQNDKDTITGDGGDDLINAGEGDDSANGGAGADDVFGLAGNDTLVGGADDDFVHGFEGDDTLNGGAGDDLVLGTDGNDIVNETSGVNIINGGPGDDILNGGTGDDTIYGDGDLNQGGNDTITGGDGVDLIVSFSGDDTIDTSGDGLVDTVNAGPHNNGDTCTADTGAIADRVFNCDP